ncbi:substrate-binding domain-containing protein [Ramlibacter ginsenosidimutans]|uniref:Substrate-binding domain-containing protein n=1 Tax=Ramlibacter ginsenosidimutans TaxID=502333 RepID=A0A934TQ60_9BURK|nr:substrate-binding domain-containing protein [Ramlibacter ginsenosidimutans]MBK6005263.1 substrate-binding domain-containing protein [Ramlibacter ginsenosidimutans]
MPKTLNILSGGAAQGLVSRLQAAFEQQHDCRLQGSFGAVGAMRDKLLGGAPCDLLILTQALVDELGRQGRADAASARPLGRVKTGVALKQQHAPVSVQTPQQLQALLAAAPEIYFPDPAKATAGIHFMKVLQALGLAQDTSRHRTYPNGAAAMAALAQSTQAEAVGCTQVTEILNTPGVQVTGVLPAPHELVTTYTAVVASGAQEPELAAALIATLTSADAADLRARCGFD